MVGKDNQKPHIRIHRMSSSSMEKQQKLFYTEEPDSIQSHFSSQPAARRPSTSKTPYQLGIMDRAATGPEDAKPPTVSEKCTHLPLEARGVPSSSDAPPCMAVRLRLIVDAGASRITHCDPSTGAAHTPVMMITPQLD